MYEGERFNSITHLIGAIAAMIGSAVLVALAARQGEQWKVVSFSIYGASLIALYSVSALYHSLRGQAKIFFRKLDHYAIYTLIAGTYTPFMLVTLRGAWGWTLFGVIWALAVIGIILEAMPKRSDSRRILSLVIYLAMGWLCVIAIVPLLEKLPHTGFILLLIGGLLYSGGIVFYVFDKRIKHFHGIWHLFVLGGSVSHFFSILLYVN
jgi:hemolysin III